MAVKHILYEKLSGRLLEEHAKPFPVNEDGFGWLKHNYAKGAPQLNFEHYIVAQGTLEDISDSLPSFPLTAADVKLECYNRIQDQYPLWKQTNISRRWTELKLKSSRTADENSELAKLDSALSWIDSMREKSNELEVAPDAAFDDAAWPTPPAEV